MKDQNEKLGKNPIYHHIKKNKIPGINLPKEAKNLYSENYNMLLKEKEKKITVGGPHLIS